MSSQERGPIRIRCIGPQRKCYEHLQRARKILGTLKENIDLGANLGQGKLQIEFEETPGAPRTVITAYTWEHDDLVVIDTSLIEEEREEERGDEYFPYFWMGVRLLSVNEGAVCAAALTPSVGLYVWEPPGSAAKSAKDRAILGSSGIEAIKTQVVGRSGQGGIGPQLSHGSYPIGNDTGCPTPAHGTTGDGSVQTILAFQLFRNLDDSNYELLREADGSLKLPASCQVNQSGCIDCYNKALGLTDADGFQDLCLRDERPDYSTAQGGSGVAQLDFLGTPAVHFTDHGMYHLAGPFAWDQKFPLDTPPDDIPDDNIWEQVVILDPDDAKKTFDVSRPYSTIAGRVAGGCIIDDPPEDWSLKGKVQGGNYVAKIDVFTEVCCGNPPTFTPLAKTFEVGMEAVVEFEIRLGKQLGFSLRTGTIEPGRTLTVRGKFVVNGASNVFRSLLPYGFYNLFGGSPDLRPDAETSTLSGPCNPNSDDNWVRDGLKINILGGSITREPEYWLEDDEDYAYNTWPGYTDVPFDLGSHAIDCGTSLICIDPPIDCSVPSAPCSNFLYTKQGSPNADYPEHVIHMTGIVICIDPNTPSLSGFLNPWREIPSDPFSAPIDRPVIIQIVNSCVASGSECEPLGNGSTFFVQVLESSIGQPFANGEEVYVLAIPTTGSLGAGVFIEKLGASNFQNSKAFNQLNLICPDSPGHRQLLGRIGAEVECQHGVEVVTTYLGEPV